VVEWSIQTTCQLCSAAVPFQSFCRRPQAADLCHSRWHHCHCFCCMSVMLWCIYTTCQLLFHSNYPAGAPRQQTYVRPDGTTVTAFGNGPPGISMTNFAPDGSSMASGSAMGDQQSVTTTTIPGGSSVTSTSFSNGPSSGPVSASVSAGAVASSSSSSGAAGAGVGGQPLYTPFQTAAPGNAATVRAG
jgi:hypothetical protein